jgi:hypothetical protein
MAKKRNAYRGLVARAKGKRAFERPRHRWDFKK